MEGYLEELRKYMPFPNGIPSVPTMSRMPAAVDEEPASLAIMNRIGEISSMRGIHTAIDGKGLYALFLLEVRVVSRIIRHSVRAGGIFYMASML